MKKSIIYFSIISAIAYTSCSTKKDWTCECQVPSLSPGVSGSTSFVLVDVTEDDAKKSCSAGNKITSQGMSIVLPCTLSNK